MVEQLDVIKRLFQTRHPVEKTVCDLEQLINASAKAPSCMSTTISAFQGPRKDLWSR